jgi:transposase
MQLSDHDLNQLDEDKLLDLPEEDLRRLSIRLLNDLKEARERLKQNSRNSSRPPSSEAPWDKANDTASDTDAIDAGEDTPDQEADNTSPAPPAKESKQDSQTDSSQASDNVRQSGKQPGAQGFGRQQVLPVTDYQDHRPELCTCCGTVFTASQQKAYTAFDTVDLTWADANDPGLRLITTRHTYYEATCHCDHVTRDEPYRHVPHGSLPNVVCSEWRLVGPVWPP